MCPGRTLAALCSLKSLSRAHGTLATCCLYMPRFILSNWFAVSLAALFLLLNVPRQADAEAKAASSVQDADKRKVATTTKVRAKPRCCHKLRACS